MTDVVINLPVLHEAQLKIARSQARYVMACCGRRFGKSEMAIAKGFYEGLVKGRVVWWCVPTHNNALQAWERLLHFARQVPLVKISLDEKEIRFPEGGSIRVVSMQMYNNVRGAGLDYIIFDECAFAEEGAWSSVLEPMLATSEYGRALFITTPNGFNWFWKMYQRGMTPTAEHESFHFTSWDNPYISRKFLENVQSSISPQVWAQEYMADFVDSAGAVFTGVKDVLQSEPPPYDPMNAYVMGIDWGRKHDFTALSVWDANRRAEMRLERFNQIGFEFQAQRVKALAEEYGVSYIVAEENGIGLPNVERLQAMGLPVEAFKMTGSSKKPVIEALALAIDQATIALLDVPEATEELYAYRTTVTPTGAIRYGAPEGGFDDTVIARALAHHACGQNVGDIIDLSEWM